MNENDSNSLKNQSKVIDLDAIKGITISASRNSAMAKLRSKVADIDSSVDSGVIGVDHGLYNDFTMGN
jgi:hypothetical protein